MHRLHVVAVEVPDEHRVVTGVVLREDPRRVEDLDVFIERLEKTGAFSGILPRGEAPEENGTLRTVIQGYYAPAAAAAVPTTPPTPANQSPGQPSNRGGTP